MILNSWRILKKKHLASAWDGEGARMRGGRWNPKGVAMVYTSGSLALATLEMLVHLEKSIMEYYSAIPVYFPDTICLILSQDDLPDDWSEGKPSGSTKEIGEHWVRDMHSAVLAVPSAIIPLEWNYLLNPNHPDFKKIPIGKPQNFTFDPRLIKS